VTRALALALSFALLLFTTVPARAQETPPPVDQAMPASEEEVPCADMPDETERDACLDRRKKIQHMRDHSTRSGEELKKYYRRLEDRTAPKAPDSPVEPE
jgi:hypothetical protein